MLESILNNPGLIKMATGKLRGFFENGGHSALLIRPNDAQTEGPLPGFDIEFYKPEITVVESAGYGALMRALETNPYAITAEENAEFEAYKSARKEMPGGGIADISAIWDTIDSKKSELLKPKTDANTTG